jgi:cold-inducible RNA-binding protein
MTAGRFTRPLPDSAGADAPLHPRFFLGGNSSVMSENRLFVGNLSFQTLENDLQDYFSQAGVVSSVNLMFDKFTGKSRGFAFIEFSTAEEAANAVEMFHGKELQGRALTVNVAKPREERAPREGGGGWRGERGGDRERRY